MSQLSQMLSKRELRKTSLAARRAMPPASRDEESRKILSKLISMKVLKPGMTVFCYVSMEDEVHTYEFLKLCHSMNIRLCIPYITDAENGIMLAAQLDSMDELIKGIYDIPTVPTNRLQEVLPEDINLVIVPGAAFDRAGNRIGMGGGFYDRFLKRAVHAYKIGLCYECQVADSIPADIYDQPVDIIVY